MAIENPKSKIQNPLTPVVNKHTLITVANVMIPALGCVSPGAHVFEALQMLQRQHMQCLVVEPLLPNGAWGIVTLRDVQTALATRGREMSRVGTVMSVPPFVVAPAMRIEDCSALMLERGLRRVVVVQQAQPVGIICDSDIFQAIEARS